MIFFNAEQAVEVGFHRGDDGDAVVIAEHAGGLAAGAFDGQGIGIVVDDLEYVLADVGDQFVASEGAGQQIQGLVHVLKLGAFFPRALFVTRAGGRLTRPISCR